VVAVVAFVVEVAVKVVAEVVIVLASMPVHRVTYPVLVLVVAYLAGRCCCCRRVGGRLQNLGRLHKLAGLGDACAMLSAILAPRPSTHPLLPEGVGVGGPESEGQGVGHPNGLPDELVLSTLRGQARRRRSPRF